jgi:type VI secretion system secreted protein Hcp
MRRPGYRAVAALLTSTVFALSLVASPFVLGGRAGAAPAQTATDPTTGSMYVDFAGAGGANDGGTQLADTPDFAVFSFSIGANNPTTISSGGIVTGKPQVSDLSIQKQVDDASPLLFQASVTGAYYPTLVLILNKNINNVPTAYLRYRLTNAYVTSWQESGSDGGGTPSESVSFTYTKIQLEYAPELSGSTLGPFEIVPFDPENP